MCSCMYTGCGKKNGPPKKKCYIFGVIKVIYLKFTGLVDKNISHDFTKFHSKILRDSRVMSSLVSEIIKFHLSSGD